MTLTGAGQNGSEYSHLSNTRELLDQIAAKLDVEEETMVVDVEYFGEIDLDEPTEENLLDEITAYFDRPVLGPEVH